MLICLPAFSQSFISDGNEFLEECAKNYVKCQGYMQGVNDTIEALKFWGKLDSCYFEFSRDVTDKQLVDLVLKYYTENPEYRHGWGPNIVINLLSETFPCKKDDIDTRIQRLLRQVNLLLLYKESLSK